MHFSILRGAAVALRRPAALSLLAVSLVAAGCASGEDADFIDGYNTAVAPLSTMMSDASLSPAGNPAAASKSMNRVADRLDDVRADLAALEAPEDATDEFDRMLVELEKGTKQVRVMARAARHNDLSKLTKATADFAATGTNLVAIEQELRTIVES
jgi:hypothetical protein